MIFTLKHSSTLVPDSSQSTFNWDVSVVIMNKRFVIVGLGLAIVITIAVFIGSPALGGLDSMR